MLRLEKEVKRGPELALGLRIEVEAGGRHPDRELEDLLNDRPVEAQELIPDPGPVRALALEDEDFIGSDNEMVGLAEAGAFKVLELEPLAREGDLTQRPKVITEAGLIPQTLPLDRRQATGGTPGAPLDRLRPQQVFHLAVHRG